jgi:hypothetical protein
MGKHGQAWASMGKHGYRQAINVLGAQGTAVLDKFLTRATHFAIEHLNSGNASGQQTPALLGCSNFNPD